MYGFGEMTDGITNINDNMYIVKSMLALLIRHVNTSLAPAINEYRNE